MVLIDRGVTIAVDTSGASPPDTAEVVDLGDLTLLPGLIDSHVHLSFSCGDDPLGPTLTDDASLLEEMHGNALLHLAAGITTVRDLGDRDFLSLELRASYRAGERIGPELLVAGPPITRTRGHLWYLGGEADGAEEVRAAAAERARRGCDTVKIMATGGFVTPGFGPQDSQYGLPELDAAVREAHRHGLPVAAHAHGRQGIADSLSAGIDSIEHCSFFNGHHVDVDRTLIDEMVGAGTVVGMTVAVEPGVANSAPLARHLAQVTANLGRMHQAGLKVACSSDSGISPMRPHGVLPHAIVTLARHGFSNAEALEAATSVAATACGLGHRKGRVARGSMPT